ncbi:uncharacterized protein PHALS_11623 [Plasmopara halstedii]|uniref:Uncharacterized protein n=1 Tax=Plasmopara halstedii TaxID=4781 RepID=A0A0P1AKA1_PLAHL|nr:uncharacterized protein PHALS_11623 [Plasmopara halstedii]CEG41265.1 hypothetical protein PHALS_11623 [Plasmopara halstedii]|eukprot:XP_024577634.1 hypothetical protein PHALS_11623 [Plasmopara halstedii]
MSTFNSHRRSLSEVYHFDYLATRANNTTKESNYLLSPEECEDDHYSFVQTVHHETEWLKHRSKSESFICTAQGVVFKCQKSQSKIKSLMALASTSSSSQSNVLLAKKALRYRKVLERQCVLA